MHSFGVASVVEKLRAAGGGYEVVHDSPGLELGVEAGADHTFTAYEQLALFVVFERAR